MMMMLVVVVLLMLVMMVFVVMMLMVDLGHWFTQDLRDAARHGLWIGRRNGCGLDGHEGREAQKDRDLHGCRSLVVVEVGWKDCLVLGWLKTFQGD